MTRSTLPSQVPVLPPERLADALEDAGPYSTEKSSLVYITSASHSGSTLLAMLLGGQIGACTAGELRAPAMGDREMYRCSCGEKIKECAFWNSVTDAMARRGIPNFDITNARTSIFETRSQYVQWLLAPLCRGRILEGVRDCALSLSPCWRRHLNSVQCRVGALIGALHEITGAKLVVDSSKSVLHLKYLLGISSLDIKVIHMIRDGRAVALSLLGHGLKRATRGETIAAAAREWRRSNEAAECLIARLRASQWIQIRYEALCRDPDKVMRSLCKFTGVDSSHLSLDFRAKPQHVIGNSMRLNSTAEIRLDERWRTELSSEDLQTFEAIAGDLNHKYGYR